jgi:hypothetical protein
MHRMGRKMDHLERSIGELMHDAGLDHHHHVVVVNAENNNYNKQQQQPSSFSPSAAATEKPVL